MKILLKAVRFIERKLTKFRIFLINKYSKLSDSEKRITIENIHNGYRV
jgi:hypothetical protein